MSLSNDWWTYVVLRIFPFAASTWKRNKNLLLISPGIEVQYLMVLNDDWWIHIVLGLIHHLRSDAVLC